MDRRLFLVSTFALAGCSGDTERQTVICDRGLSDVLMRARTAYGREGALVINEAGAGELLDRAENEPSALVVTRQSMVANRLQRLGYVRLEHRWQARVDGGTVEILVTKGWGLDQQRALRLAKWLAGEDAAPLLGAVTAP